MVRHIGKGETWAKRGCDLVEADINNAAALTSAFKGVDGVFVLVPPNFDPSPDFREAQTTATALRSALDAARPGRVVYLSTIGAQATQSNLLTQHSMIEQALRELPIPIISAATRPMIQTEWNGRRVVELEGAHRVTPNEIAAGCRGNRDDGFALKVLVSAQNGRSGATKLFDHETRTLPSWISDWPK